MHAPNSIASRVAPHGVQVFFFQAEDGIRDYKVTGVQTCALPISARRACASYRAVVRKLFELGRFGQKTGAGYYRYDGRTPVPDAELSAIARSRSEERRVGKECRSRWSPYH